MSVKIEFNSNHHSCQTTPNRNGSSQVSNKGEKNRDLFKNLATPFTQSERNEMKQLYKDIEKVDLSHQSVKQYIQEYNEVAKNYSNKKYTAVFANLLNCGK